MKKKSTNYIKDYFAYSPVLRENEADANKQMVIACGFSAVILLIFFFLYVTHVFPLRSYNLIYIFMPLGIILLLSTFILFKLKIFERPWIKYYLLGLFIFVCSTMNVIVPKHAIIAWALPIVLANHYYSRKVGLIVFFSCIIMMLCCIYLGMFVGEYDPNLLGEGIVMADGTIYQPENPKERYDMLQQMIINRGHNRYARVLVFYYLPRAIILSIIFFVSQLLNKRTFILLQKEKTTSIEKEKIENELQIAAQIQLAALPKPHFKTQEVLLFGALYPAKQIGGDFYDYYFLDRHHLAFVIGDVSGKGAPAALFMMKTITCFKNAASLDKSPLETMQEVNTALMQGNDGQMFVTAFFGILDTRNGEIRYVNAGHCPPLMSRNGKYNYLPCDTGFVLGALDPVPLKEEVVRIEPGTMFALYTDGVTEAKNVNNELYGKKRLLEVANRFHYHSVHDFFREVQDDIMTFSSLTPQADDLTCLVLHYMYEQIHYEELSMECTEEDVKKAIDFIEDSLKKDGLHALLGQSFAIVVDEIYSNIAKYAYTERKGYIFIRYCYYKDSHFVRLTFIDRGAPYDPTKGIIEAPKLEKEGGLGLFIVSNIMDEVDYDRRNGKNFLVLDKRVER